MASHSIRLCHSVNFDYLLTYARGTTFYGAFASFTQDILTTFAKNTNFTFTVQPNRGFGRKVGPGNSYDGCLGMIQRNESDILLALVDYPLDVTNVVQGNLMSDSVMQFLTIYEMKEHTFAAQMLSSFESFSVNIWLTLVLTVLTVYSVMKFRIVFFTRSFAKKRLRLRCKNYYTLYRIVTHLTRIGRMEQKGCFNKIIFISLSIPSLVLVHYFYTLIKTDLVIVEHPQIFKSYDDLIMNDVTISFYADMNHDKYFKTAPPGSREKELWNRASSLLGDQVSIKLDTSTATASHLHRFMQRKEVFFTDDIVSVAVRHMACKVKSDPTYFQRSSSLFGLNETVQGFNFYFAQDQNAIKTLRGLIWSTFFTGPASAMFKTRLKHFFETGLVEFAAKKESRADLADSFGFTTPKEPKKMEELRHCIEGDKTKSKTTLDALKFVNMQSFVKVIAFLFLITGVVVYYEYLHRK